MDQKIDGHEEADSVRSLTFLESFLSLLLRNLPIKNGKHRLLDKLFPRAWSKSGKEVYLRYRGVKLRISIDELVGWHFAILHSFDPEVVESLYMSSKNDGEHVFWDIGANKCFCAFEFSFLFPNAKIVAIEPQSTLREDNLYNLEKTSHGRFEYYQFGIGEKEEKLELIIPNDNVGRATLHASAVSENDRTEIIEIVTAEKIVRKSKFGWPTLVKIDVEGHELAVIRSLSEALEKGICEAIVFENHFSQKDNFVGIQDIACRLDYSIYAISKSVFNTKLDKTAHLIEGVTDYVMLKN